MRCVAQHGSRRAGAGGRGGANRSGRGAIAKADGAQVVVADTSPARLNMWQRVWSCPCWTRQPKILRAAAGAVWWFAGAESDRRDSNQHAMNNTVNLIRHGGTVVLSVCLKVSCSSPIQNSIKKKDDDG